MKKTKPSLILILSAAFFIMLFCVTLIAARYITRDNSNGFSLNMTASFYVSFDPSPGVIKSGEAVHIVELGKSVTDMPAAEREGYTLTGWEGPEAIIEPGGPYTLTKAEDCVLTALWNPDTHKIFLDANDKTGSTRAEGLVNTVSEAVYDSKYTEDQLPNLTRRGYLFEGWFDKDGKEYKVNDTVQLTADTKLYAEWTPIEYIITYKSPKELTNYQRVEYLQSDGKVAIDTEAMLNQDSTVSVDFEFTSLAQEYNFIFGARKKAGVEEFETIYTTNGGANQIRDDYGNQEGGQGDRIFTGFVPETGVKYRIEKSGNLLSIDGKTVAVHKNASFTEEYSLYLFNTNYDNAFKTSEGAIGKMYGAKVWNGDTLARNMFPCINTLTNEPGMYDTVTGRFLKKAGPGSITLGPVTFNQQPVSFDETANLASEIEFQSEFITLLGWSTDPAAEEPEYAPGQAICNLSDTDGDEIVLYPVYVYSRYRELEYIQSTGLEYIDTGVVLNQDSKVIMQFAFTDFNRKYSFIFGARSEAGKNEFEICYTAEETADGKKVLRDDYNLKADRVFTSFAPAVKEKFTLEKSGNVLKINDETVATHDPKTFNTSYTLCLFCTNYAGKNSGEYAIGRLYNCQVWQGDKLVRDFVPVYSNEDNTAGLLDKVDRTFYQNAGGGNFIPSTAAAGLTLVYRNESGDSETILPRK